MIDVGEIVVDPDFAQPFNYIRREISWQGGRKVITETNHQAYGIVIADDLKDMGLTPQGVLTTGVITIWTHEKLMVTSETHNGPYLSDLVIYKGQRYIVHNDRDMSEYGYSRYHCTVESSND